jgi:hypothetical protein
VLFVNSAMAPGDLAQSGNEAMICCFRHNRGRSGGGYSAHRDAPFEPVKNIAMITRMMQRPISIFGALPE